MSYFDILKYLFLFNFIAILIEYIYSSIKKDGIYDNVGTLNNVLSGVVLNQLSARVFVVYFAFVIKYLGFLPKSFELKFSLPNFIFCLFFVDFMYYVFHYLHHKFGLLWSFHIVHHSDKKLNLSTAERISWVEQFYIFIFFLPVHYAGFSAATIFLAFYVLSLYQFYCHSQYIKLPRFFDYLFVTPHNHRVHHDESRLNQSSNMGGVFSIWDRMFGTYVPEIKEFNPGVKSYKELNFLKYQFAPFINYLKSYANKNK